MAEQKQEQQPGVGDDFYRHVNHAWLTDPATVIPEEYPRWGSFIQLVDESLKNQIAMLKEMAAKENPTAEEQILKTIWNASFARFKDWEEGKTNFDAIHEEIKLLNEHLDAGRVAEYFARAQEFGISTPIGLDKECNLDSSSDVVLEMGPGGLSLPSRDYYLDAEKFSEQQAWFIEHLNKVEKIVGGLEEDFADKVMHFETKLAMITMKKDQSRQFDQYYTITTLDELGHHLSELKYLPAKLDNYPNHSTTEDEDVLAAKEVDFTKEDREFADQFMGTMFKELKIVSTMESNYAKNYPDGDSEAAHRVMLFDGDFYTRLMMLLRREHNQSMLRAYLQYKIIKMGSEFCSKELNEEIFDMYSRKLAGQSKQKTDEKRSVTLINAWVGELLGKMYVERHFPAESKAAVSSMIGDVIDVMEESIAKSDWLTEDTKKAAHDKLSKFSMKIGYPDKWKSFDELDLSPEDSLFAMQQKVTAFEFKTELLKKVNSKKDKTEWAMTPQTVNAYFNPLLNEIVFPAAIIQPPFFAKSVDEVDFELTEEDKSIGEEWILDALNFGGIGAVIAHEITHGYDDNGKKFNGDGNIQDWWTKEDADLFKSKTELMIKQAALWSLDMPTENGATKTYKMNGELTMGENLADLGGMSLSCKALTRRLEEKGVSEETRKNTLRVFFKSWGNIWRSKETDQFTIKQVTTDPHAPCSFRANLVKNIDQWYEVFEVAESDAMFLPKDMRLQMW